MLYVLFGGSLLLLIALTVTAAYFVLQKRDEDGNLPKIHRSGAFSIIHQSPHEALQSKKLTKEQVQSSLEQAKLAHIDDSLVNKYQNLWNEILNESTETIEAGDRDGLQTFCYEVPEKDAKTCSQFSSGVYVTREQLQNHPELIPPFHLGCAVRLHHKNAWNTNLDGSGWKALLPIGGKYHVPDWRTVSEI